MIQNLSSVLLSCFVLASLTCCDGVPKELDQRFTWQESVSHMEKPLFGSCEFAGDLYMVGGLSKSAVLYRWTGHRWQQEASQLNGERLWSCWAGPDKAIFAVGQAGTIFRHNSEGWHQDTLPPELEKVKLFGVWGMQDGSAVAVGGELKGKNNAVILHFDGTSWTQAETDLIMAPLRAVWGSQDGTYWAVGDAGTIFRYDGENWLPSNSGTKDNLYGIMGISSNEVYAVGGNGTGVIRRFNGTSWVYFDTTQNSLRSIWTTPNKALYVAGDAGFVARYSRFGHIPSPDYKTAANAFPHLRINHLVGAGAGIVSSASTSMTAENGDFQGAIVSHGQSFAGTIFEF